MSCQQGLGFDLWSEGRGRGGFTIFALGRTHAGANPPTSQTCLTIWAFSITLNSENVHLNLFRDKLAHLADALARYLAWHDHDSPPNLLYLYKTKISFYSIGSFVSIFFHSLTSQSLVPWVPPAPQTEGEGEGTQSTVWSLQIPPKLYLVDPKIFLSGSLTATISFWYFVLLGSSRSIRAVGP